MKYISTRGAAPEIDFRKAVLTGLASDGGLYVPASWPAPPAEFWTGLRAMSFEDAAAGVLSLFAGATLSKDELAAMARRAYASFDRPEIAPVDEIGDGDFLLELFHGPTLAFKDIAMSMLAQLYDWALADAARGKTIIGATSGDTGGAAIHAFAGSEKAEIFMLHPLGRISEVQRRIMTTATDRNVVNIAVEGSFDDCQRIVKMLFADRDLAAAVDLGGVNSINWVRLAIQTVYYATSGAMFDRPMSYVVPTGNFGDVFAGYVAKKMGAPVARLGVAVNVNDIMRRAIETGVYEPQKTLATTSPSMDIQIASNFERLLFDAFGRDAASLRALMDGFDEAGRMVLPEPVREAISVDFSAARASESAVSAKIDAIYKTRGMMIDPHTAVGLVALDQLREAGDFDGPAICLATAHPAKFPDAVETACGARPQLPERYRDLMKRDERLLTAKADPAEIKNIIRSKSLFI